mmetsp:Transcript_14680/g.52283  ORF Transcript_14680/g.52283 Transcript_14680/m.52283 type:complete len:240 (+) Transcript_14680:1898-2617(+)
MRSPAGGRAKRFETSLAARGGLGGGGGGAPRSGEALRGRAARGGGDAEGAAGHVRSSPQGARARAPRGSHVAGAVRVGGGGGGFGFGGLACRVGGGGDGFPAVRHEEVAVGVDEDADALADGRRRRLALVARPAFGARVHRPPRHVRRRICGVALFHDHDAERSAALLVHDAFVALELFGGDGLESTDQHELRLLLADGRRQRRHRRPGRQGEEEQKATSQHADAPKQQSVYRLACPPC